MAIAASKRQRVSLYCDVIKNTRSSYGEFNHTFTISNTVVLVKNECLSAY